MTKNDDWFNDWFGQIQNMSNGNMVALTLDKLWSKNDISEYSKQLVEYKKEYKVFRNADGKHKVEKKG